VVFRSSLLSRLGGTVLSFWPLILFAALVVVVVVSMLLLSGLLGERAPGRDSQDPYESGIPPSGSPQARHAVHFYLVAVFFLVFDLEAVFLFAWAVAASELGWKGYASAVLFTGVLLAALIYLWKDGGLDWGSSRRVREAGAGLLAVEAMGGQRTDEDFPVSGKGKG